NTGVRVGHAVLLEDGASEVLDVDLVDDTSSRRNDAEVLEGAGAPTQELVALLVALVLDLDVLLEGLGSTECLDDDGVVDDHLSWLQRVDLVSVAAQGNHCVADGCEVNDARHAGEVLHDHTSRGELDLDGRISLGIPVRDGLDVLTGDVLAILVP